MKLRVDSMACHEQACRGTCHVHEQFKLLSCCHMQVVIHGVSYVVGRLMRVASGSRWKPLRQS